MKFENVFSSLTLYNGLIGCFKAVFLSHFEVCFCDLCLQCSKEKQIQIIIKKPKRGLTISLVYDFEFHKNIETKIPITAGTTSEKV